ncbi:riboflavin kinase [Diplodia intermedia]|uniref:Riboflavin kinase n=1 Tax=Diplodia intermedia TaxID=856260 RepID=A0ABR3U5P2_9PEZI
MRPDGPRDPIAGPDVPEPPFPLKLGGKVIKGFGRGSKELGIPTANIPLAGLSVGGHDDLESGIYYGWAGLDFVSNDPANGSVSPTDTANGTSNSSSGASITSKVKNAVGTALFGSTADDNVSQSEAQQQEANGSRIHPMVMSVGWNPFYKNSVRSVEVHIMHDFRGRDFYGSRLNLVILGFIRPEFDYVSKESLIDDIRTDIEVAAKSLERPAYADVKRDPFLVDFPKDDEGRSLKDDVAS